MLCRLEDTRASEDPGQDRRAGKTKKAKHGKKTNKGTELHHEDWLGDIHLFEFLVTIVSELSKCQGTIDSVPLGFKRTNEGG